MSRIKSSLWVLHARCPTSPRWISCDLTFDVSVRFAHLGRELLPLSLSLLDCYPPDLVVCVRAPEKREQEARDKRKKTGDGICTGGVYLLVCKLLLAATLSSSPYLDSSLGSSSFLFPPLEHRTPHPPTPILASSLGEPSA